MSLAVVLKLFDFIRFLWDMWLQTGHDDFNNEKTNNTKCLTMILATGRQDKMTRIYTLIDEIISEHICKRE